MSILGQNVNIDLNIDLAKSETKWNRGFYTKNQITYVTMRLNYWSPREPVTPALVFLLTVLVDYLFGYNLLRLRFL